MRSFPIPERNEAGKLPAFAWGYPLVYYTDDGESFCPDCANGKNGSDARTEPNAEQQGGWDDAQWLLTMCDVYWEGPPLACVHCGTAIDSAYGDPDDPDDPNA